MQMLLLPIQSRFLSLPFLPPSHTVTPLPTPFPFSCFHTLPLPPPSTVASSSKRRCDRAVWVASLLYEYFPGGCRWEAADVQEETESPGIAALGGDPAAGSRWGLISSSCSHPHIPPQGTAVDLSPPYPHQPPLCSFPCPNPCCWAAYARTSPSAVRHTGFKAGAARPTGRRSRRVLAHHPPRRPVGRGGKARCLPAALPVPSGARRSLPMPNRPALHWRPRAGEAAGKRKEAAEPAASQHHLPARPQRGGELAGKWAGGGHTYCFEWQAAGLPTEPPALVARLRRGRAVAWHRPLRRCAAAASFPARLAARRSAVPR
jgi:hypothetical protein